MGFYSTSQHSTGLTLAVSAVPRVPLQAGAGDDGLVLAAGGRGVASVPSRQAEVQGQAGGVGRVHGVAGLALAGIAARRVDAPGQEVRHRGWMDGGWWLPSVLQGAVVTRPTTRLETLVDILTVDAVTLQARRYTEPHTPQDDPVRQ